MDVVVDRDTWSEFTAENIGLLAYYGDGMGTSCSRSSFILVNLGIFRTKKILIIAKFNLDFMIFSCNKSRPTGKVMTERFYFYYLKKKPERFVSKTIEIPQTRF